ncbi:hypothetical protein DRJ22_03790, partial [Candidatus Woesearchaeota archaeon]
ETEFSAPVGVVVELTDGRTAFISHSFDSKFEDLTKGKEKEELLEYIGREYGKLPGYKIDLKPNEFTWARGGWKKQALKEIMNEKGFDIVIIGHTDLVQYKKEHPEISSVEELKEIGFYAMDRAESGLLTGEMIEAKVLLPKNVKQKIKDDLEKAADAAAEDNYGCSDCEEVVKNFNKQLKKSPEAALKFLNDHFKGEPSFSAECLNNILNALGKIDLAAIKDADPKNTKKEKVLGLLIDAHYNIYKAMIDEWLNEQNKKRREEIEKYLVIADLELQDLLDLSSELRLEVATPLGKILIKEQLLQMIKGLVNELKSIKKPTKQILMKFKQKIQKKFERISERVTEQEKKSLQEAEQKEIEEIDRLIEEAELKKEISEIVEQEPELENSVIVIEDLVEKLDSQLKEKLDEEEVIDTIYSLQKQISEIKNEKVKNFYLKKFNELKEKAKGKIGEEPEEMVTEEMIIKEETPAKEAVAAEVQVLKQPELKEKPEIETKVSELENLISQELISEDKVKEFVSKITEDKLKETLNAIERLLESDINEEQRNKLNLLKEALKEKVRRKAEELAKAGMFEELLKLVDDPELVSRLTEFSKEKLLYFFNRIVKEQEGREPGKSEVKAKIYTTTQKAPGWKRSEEQAEYPIVIIGEVYDKNLKPLPVKEVEDIYGLKYTKKDIIVKKGGGRMVYLDYPMTIVLDKEKNIKNIFFGKLEKHQLSLENGDEVKYGNALEIKGAGTPNFRGFYYEEQPEELTQEQFEDLLKDTTEASKREILEFLERNKKLQKVVAIKDKFYTKTEQGTYKVIVKENIKGEYPKTGMFKDFRYQPDSKEPVGMVLFDGENIAKQNQRDLLKNGMQANVLVVDIVPLDSYLDPHWGEGGHYRHGISYRVTLGKRKRTLVVDAASFSKPETFEKIRKTFDFAWHVEKAKDKQSLRREKMKLLFNNIGKNTNAFLLSDFVFLGRRLYVGKDLDAEGTLADFAEFIKIDKTNPLYNEERKILIRKWFDYLNRIFFAYQENNYLFFNKGLESEYFNSYLKGIFENSEKYVEKVTAELKELLLIVSEKYAEAAREQKESKINVPDYLKEYVKIALSKFPVSKFTTENLYSIVEDLVAEVIYKNWNDYQEFKTKDKLFQIKKELEFTKEVKLISLKLKSRISNIPKEKKKQLETDYSKIIESVAALRTLAEGEIDITKLRQFASTIQQLLKSPLIDSKNKKELETVFNEKAQLEQDLITKIEDENKKKILQEQLDKIKADFESSKEAFRPEELFATREAVAAETKLKPVLPEVSEQAKRKSKVSKQCRQEKECKSPCSKLIEEVEDGIEAIKKSDPNVKPDSIAKALITLEGQVETEEEANEIQDLRENFYKVIKEKLQESEPELVIPDLDSKVVFYRESKDVNEVWTFKEISKNFVFLESPAGTFKIPIKTFNERREMAKEHFEKLLDERKFENLARNEQKKELLKQIPIGTELEFTSIRGNKRIVKYLGIEDEVIRIESEGESLGYDLNSLDRIAKPTELIENKAYEKYFNTLPEGYLELDKKTMTVKGKQHSIGDEVIVYIEGKKITGKIKGFIEKEGKLRAVIMFKGLIPEPAKSYVKKINGFNFIRASLSILQKPDTEELKAEVGALRKKETTFDEELEAVLEYLKAKLKATDKVSWEDVYAVYNGRGEKRPQKEQVFSYLKRLLLFKKKEILGEMHLFFEKKFAKILEQLGLKDQQDEFEDLLEESKTYNEFITKLSKEGILLDTEAFKQEEVSYVERLSQGSSYSSFYINFNEEYLPDLLKEIKEINGEEFGFKVHYDSKTKRADKMVIYSPAQEYNFEKATFEELTIKQKKEKARKIAKKLLRLYLEHPEWFKEETVLFAKRLAP